ncbi:MAG: YicC/YloC family endoribonuclease [Thermoanaerobaculia bacterium]|nr:YicC/YloC family endoribonuclease [Thermoanaerobaculia bacterium]
MRSMTGYGQAQGGDERHRVSVTLRSVNGKYLDLNLRLREEHRDLEPRLRTLLEQELERGRVDATVEVRSRIPRAADVNIQMEVVQALHTASHELAEKGLIATELRLADLLALPEVVELEVEPDNLTDRDEMLVLSVCREALGQLVEARALEGEQLAGTLEERLEDLVELAETIGELASTVRDRIRSRLEERVREILEGEEIEESRIAQEVAVLVDKSDVAEELDRLDSHLEHFRGVCSSEGAIGKRLDFLTQEILRELNTIGAKSRDAEMTRRVVDAKVVCEQLREQVQNVE